MRIGLFGSMFLHIKMSLDNEFNPLGINKGHAISDYSGLCFDLAKKLCRKNEVIFLTGSDTSITSTPSFSSIVQWIKNNEKMVFDSIDMLVIETIDEDIIRLCRENKKPYFILMEDESIYERLDDNDYDLISGAEILYPNNALDILSEWMKLTKEEQKMRYDYNDIVGRWKTLTDHVEENLDFLEGEADEYANAEVLKRLIYDSYQYYRVRLAGTDSVPCNKLLPYKYAAQMIWQLGTWAGGKVEAFESALKGLCYLIENGYNTNYEDYALPYLPTMHSDAGGTADMSSYENFVASFEKHLKRTQEHFDLW